MSTPFFNVLLVICAQDVGLKRLARVLLCSLVVWRYRIPRTRALRTLVSLACLVVVVGTIVGSYYLMVFYNPNDSLQAAINYSLSERLRLLSKLFETYPPKLLVQDFSQLHRITYSNGWKHHVYADNTYVRHLINFGYLYTTAFFGLLVALYAKVVLERRALTSILLSIRVLYLGEPLSTLDLCEPLDPSDLDDGFRDQPTLVRSSNEALATPSVDTHKMPGSNHVS